jgi:plastocyanin
LRGAAPRLARLALAGAAIIGVGGGPAAAAPAPAQGCIWHRHSKRVVRHLRRHGQGRAVRRVRHWWTCDAQPASAPSLVPPEEPPLEETKPAASHLGVKAVEWHYTLSRPEVSAGEVVVELDNQGEDSHNLKLQREGSGEAPLEVPEAAAAAQTSARLDLPPGTYHLYCSLYQHEEKGMNATLVVGGG